MTAGQTAGPRNLGLDLLRAAAIVLVLAAHLGDRALWGNLGFTPMVLSLLGHLGVELFFVLSGYLIGNLLLDILREPPTLRDWAVFMARRVMRTMPAYLLWIALLLLTRPLGPSAPYVWQFATFTQNLAWPMPPGSWFAVSWSLTVEEWFYLLFSATALGLARLQPRSGFWLALAGFLVVPTVLRALAPIDIGWDASIRQVVSYRLDAIAYGVLAAGIMRDTTVLQRHWRTALGLGLALVGGVVGVWLLALGAWEPTSPLWRVWVFNVTSIGLALLIPAALVLHLTPGRLTAAIGTLSTLSYGIYLNHVPMLSLTKVFYKHGVPLSLVGIAIAMAASLGAAWLSWRYLEKPILDMRPSQRRRQSSAIAAPAPGAA